MYQHGYTLIEALCVISITAILLSISLRNHTFFHLKVELNSLFLKQTLQTARLLAVLNKHNVSLCPSTERSICLNHWHQAISLQLLNNKLRKLLLPTTTLTPNSLMFNHGNEIIFSHHVIEHSTNGTLLLTNQKNQNNNALIINVLGRIR